MDTAGRPHGVRRSIPCCSPPSSSSSASIPSNRVGSSSPSTASSPPPPPSPYTRLHGAVSVGRPRAQGCALVGLALGALPGSHAVRRQMGMGHALTAFLFAWIIVLALRLRGIGSLKAEGTGNSQQETENAPKRESQLFPDTCSLSPASSWLLFGLLWGLIALSNSSLLTFLPACGLWIVWPALRGLGAPFMARSDMGGSPPALLVGRIGGIKSVFIGPILSAFLFIAVISPWVIRNWVVFHAFVPMRSNFGAELYEATIFSNDGFPWMATLPLAETAPEFRRYERLGEIAYSKQQGEIAKTKIHAHPGLFARNALRRVYFFWISVPHPTDSGVSVEAIRRINFSFTSFAGLLGLALAIRRRVPAAWLFFWAFAIIPFIYYFVTVQARFRHPLEPIICVLAVYLFQSADRTRTWSWQKTAGDSQ